MAENTDDFMKFSALSWDSRAEFQHTKAVAWTCFVEKVLLEILQNSQQNTYARVFF